MIQQIMFMLQVKNTVDTHTTEPKTMPLTVTNVIKISFLWLIIFITFQEKNKAIKKKIRGEQIPGWEGCRALFAYLGLIHFQAVLQIPFTLWNPN